MKRSRSLPGSRAFRDARVKATCLVILALFGLLGCQQRPPTPQEIQDQQRFMTGCRPADAARDPTGYEAYCDRF